MVANLSNYVMQIDWTHLTGLCESSRRDKLSFQPNLMSSLKLSNKEVFKDTKQTIN